MSRERKARAGAQVVIAGDTITDVALTVPRGATTAGIIGGAVGGSISQGTGGTTGAWMPLGMVVGERIGAQRAGMPPSIVLAVSATAVYALGRPRSGLFGGWDKLTPLLKIDRQHLEVRHRRRLSYRRIDLIDTTTGAAFSVEAQNIGNLGITKFLANFSVT